MKIPVPLRMLSSELRFFHCRITTTAPAISSGRPKGDFVKLIFRRQYITSIPMIAAGSTLPRYAMYAGVCFLKMMNGRNRRSQVVTLAGDVRVDLFSVS